MRSTTPAGSRSRAPAAGTRSPADSRMRSAGDDRSKRNLLPPRIALDGRRRRDGRPQPVRSLLRSVRLPEVDADADENDRDDDERVGRLAERRRDRACDQKNDDERIREPLKELHDRGEPVDVNGLVRAVLCEAAGRFSAGQGKSSAPHVSTTDGTVSCNKPATASTARRASPIG